MSKAVLLVVVLSFLCIGIKGQDDVFVPDYEDLSFNKVVGKGKPSIMLLYFENNVIHKQ